MTPEKQPWLPDGRAMSDVCDQAACLLETGAINWCKDELYRSPGEVFYEDDAEGQVQAKTYAHGAVCAVGAIRMAVEQSTEPGAVFTLAYRDKDPGLEGAYKFAADIVEAMGVAPSLSHPKSPASYFFEHNDREDTTKADVVARLRDAAAQLRARGK